MHRKKHVTDLFSSYESVVAAMPPPSFSSFHLTRPLVVMVMADSGSSTDPRHANSNSFSCDIGRRPRPPAPGQAPLLNHSPSHTPLPLSLPPSLARPHRTHSWENMLQRFAQQLVRWSIRRRCGKELPPSTPNNPCTKAAKSREQGERITEPESCCRRVFACGTQWSPRQKDVMVFRLRVAKWGRYPSEL